MTNVEKNTAAIVSCLEGLQATARRLQDLGEHNSIRVLDDFAHHPTAVKETIDAIRATNPIGRVWALFEPRSATSCQRIFQNAFADSLQLADEVVIE